MHFSVAHAVQKGLFGGLALGTYASVQLEFKRADRKPLKAATVKGKGTEAEQLPLYTNKDSVVGEVTCTIASDSCLLSCVRRQVLNMKSVCRFGLQTPQARRLSIRASRFSCLAR